MEKMQQEKQQYLVMLFKWLFFDKDSSDRKDFNIKTLDENNKPIHF